MHWKSYLLDRPEDRRHLVYITEKYGSMMQASMFEDAVCAFLVIFVKYLLDQIDNIADPKDVFHLQIPVTPNREEILEDKSGATFLEWIKKLEEQQNQLIRRIIKTFISTNTHSHQANHSESKFVQDLSRAQLNPFSQQEVIEAFDFLLHRLGELPRRPVGQPSHSAGILRQR